MNSHTDLEPRFIFWKQIQDYDNQILQLQAIKAKTKEQLDKEAAPVLTQMKAVKRKFIDVKNGDFEQLKELLVKERGLVKNKESEKDEDSKNQE